MFDIDDCRPGISSIPSTIYIRNAPLQPSIASIRPFSTHCFLFCSLGSPQPFLDGTSPCDNSRRLHRGGHTQGAANKGRFVPDAAKPILPRAIRYRARIERLETSPAIFRRSRIADTGHSRESTERRLCLVVSTGGRNTLIFEERWSVRNEVSSSHLLFGRAAC